MEMGETLDSYKSIIKEAKEKKKRFKKRHDDMPENVKNALQVVIEAIEKKEKGKLMTADNKNKYLFLWPQ